MNSNKACCLGNTGKLRLNLLYCVIVSLFGLLNSSFLSAAEQSEIHTTDIAVVKQATENWRSQNGLTILNDFRSLLSLPNIASNQQDMQKNADWIEAYLAKRDFKTQRLNAGGAPYIYAELINPQAKKTVLIYAHFDGQPIDASKWLTPAWQPTVRDNTVEAGGKDVAWPTQSAQINKEWRLFARSAGDDKAPVIALMAALDALHAAGIKPSVNIKLILDGEEEAGSPTLEKILQQHAGLLTTDLMLFCDGPMHQSGQRQLVFGVRGTHELNLTTYGPSRPLHSGHYGNWAPNAAEQMANVLASLHDANGRIAVKDFYADARAMTQEEKSAIQAMPSVEQQLQTELSINQPRMSATRLEEAIMQPSIVITGIQVGSTGDQARNVLVPQAQATINFRLVANQTPQRVQSLIDGHFKSLGYWVINQPATPEILSAHAKVLTLAWSESAYPAFRASLTNPMAIKLSATLATIDNQPPLMTPAMGGSLPIYLFESAIKAPIIILPIANHDNNQHGPNENLKIHNLWQAIDTYAAVITGL